MKIKFAFFPAIASEMNTVSPDVPSEKPLVRDHVSRHHCRIRWIYYCLYCLFILYPVSGIASEDQAELWKALKTDSAIVLLRHAIAPGTGDPEHFDVKDCSTQRLLSGAGREQAVKIGNLFRMQQIENARVLSSQWCRCLETARLLKIGPVAELPYLNSFFQHYERHDSQTQKLKEWLGNQNLSQPLVLVTHQVNITSLTSIYPSSGELVFIRRSESGEISVLGTIKTE